MTTTLIKLYSLQAHQYYNHCLKVWKADLQKRGILPQNWSDQYSQLKEKNEAKIKKIRYDYKYDHLRLMDELYLLSLEHRDQLST
ncbi:MAG: hypothetical protein FJX80_16100, partial [Bacteroidetes bacterium]|nr:hypothetical protein [Bacteroidota bacterium]